MTIRPTIIGDLDALAQIADATLFPADMLAPMARPSIEGDDPAVWMTALAGDTPVGFCFATPEEMTDGAWNMKALAVAPSHQRHGHARRLVAALEEHLSGIDAQVLVVDTASDPEQAAARAFYA